MAFREVGMIFPYRCDVPISITYGSSSHVEFDFDLALKYYRKNPGKKLEFIHTHNDLPSASAIDYNCIKGFQCVFPKFSFLIYSFKDRRNFNIIGFECNRKEILGPFVYDVPHINDLTVVLHELSFL